MAIKPDTLRRKKAKPAGSCSFGWCSRPPSPGLKTCAKCRLVLKAYRARVGR